MDCKTEAYLGFLVDHPPDEAFQNEPTRAEGSRASNGDCLLSWNTANDRPGRHAVQACLIVSGEDRSKPAEIRGPIKSYFSSNLCWFFEEDDMFDDGIKRNCPGAQSNSKRL